jgi:glycosyltransferase involved in cell wall biosynthesis
MEVGGSQLNAVQLAGAIRDRGHQILVLSEMGPLVDKVRALRLEHFELPAQRRRPSLTVASLIRRLVDEHGVDIVHGYEWPPILDAFIGLGAFRRTSIVGTIMSKSVASFVPKSIPLTVGTEFIRQAAVADGFSNVSLIEPPVDTMADSPRIDGSGFRLQHGIKPDDVLIAMICRLVPDLKLEGLLSTCDAIRDLVLSGRTVRLLIVGDGRARDAVLQRAAAINAELGGDIILPVGEMADPSPAYAAADIMVGQGGSALRSAAFGKPLVVIGEDGFSEMLTPQSSVVFLQQGWYGLGAGSRGLGVPALYSALLHLVDSTEERRELGLFGRQLAEDRFSLDRAAELIEKIYLSAMLHRESAWRWATELAWSNVGLFTNKLNQKYRRWRGTVSTDDCNARDLISSVLTNGRPAR